MPSRSVAVMFPSNLATRPSSAVSAAARELVSVLMFVCNVESAAERALASLLMLVCCAGAGLVGEVGLQRCDSRLQRGYAVGKIGCRGLCLGRNRRAYQRCKKDDPYGTGAVHRDLSGRESANRGASPG